MLNHNGTGQSNDNKSSLNEKKLMEKTIVRHFPSLNALRAFEASARHLSFTKAAEELCVTQGAVSRQIKQLEEQIQVPLFLRGHRHLILTDQGRILLAPLTEAFDLMATALERLKNQPRDLRLKVHPTFAIRWLIPRLHRFPKRSSRDPGEPHNLLHKR